jgi:hypothetical protein
MNGTINTAEFRAVNKIDANGFVRGCSVLTEGEATGHGIHIDSTSIELARKISASFTGGIKVKMEHTYGVDKIIGALRNFRTDGKQLRADLQLLKAHPAFNFVRELIEKQPTTFGLSISFSFSREKIDGKDYVRFEDVYSVDIVDRPAANPGGLFSAKPIAPTRDILKLTAAYIAAYGEDGARQMQALPECERRDRMERAIYYSGCTIPNYDFSYAARFGEPKAVWGTRRGEVAAQQDRINNCLQRLK